MLKPARRHRRRRRRLLLQPWTPGDLWCVLRAVRWPGLQVYRLDPTLNWLPIKQSAYLTSLPLPVLSFPVPLNTPPTHTHTHLHLLLIFPHLHRHIRLSLSVIPPLPSPLRLWPSPHPHSLLTAPTPLYLNPSLSLSLITRCCIRFLSLSFSHLSPDVIFALFLSYTFSRSIHQSLLK